MSRSVHERQLAELSRRFGEILHTVWDPIGVAREPAARDEYDIYVPQLLRLLRDGASEQDLVTALVTIQTESMGLSEDPRSARRAAGILFSWWVRIVEGRDPSSPRTTDGDSPD